MDIINNISSYTLYLTNNCMLKCPYCYERVRREKEGLYIMPWEDIQAILDYAIKNTDINKDLEFSLFGGEPLFYLEQQIFPIIKYLKKNCKRKYKITIMSNGVNLTKELINHLEGLDWFILISLDGPYDIIQNQINIKIYNKILDNILSLPKEIRKKHIGVKATLSDEIIKDIDKIYDFLYQLDTGIVYLSPTQEIDKIKIKTAISTLGKSKIQNTRDGKILMQEYSLNSNLQLFFKMNEIFIRGNSYANLEQRPCGWIKNGKISISSFLIEKNLKKYPQLLKGKLALTPEKEEDCNNCILKDKYCLPQKIQNYNHLTTTNCLWYRNLMEELNGLS